MSCRRLHTTCICITSPSYQTAMHTNEQLLQGCHHTSHSNPLLLLIRILMLLCHIHEQGCSVLLRQELLPGIQSRAPWCRRRSGLVPAEPTTGWPVHAQQTQQVQREKQTAHENRSTRTAQITALAKHVEHGLVPQTLCRPLPELNLQSCHQQPGHSQPHLSSASVAAFKRC